MSFLNGVAQNWTQHLRSLTVSRAGGQSCPGPAATLLLVQGWGQPGALQGLPGPKSRTCHWACGTSDHWSDPSDPSAWPVQSLLQSHPGLQDSTPTQPGVPCTLPGAALNSYSGSLIKMLNRTGPSTEPWGTQFVTHHQLDLATTLWVWPSSLFFTHWTVHPIKAWAANDIIWVFLHQGRENGMFDAIHYNAFGYCNCSNNSSTFK